MTSTNPDVGLLRRLARLTDRDGLIRAAAIDHPENYDLLFDSDLANVSFAEVVESKLELIAAMSGHASALLLDPRASVGQAIVTGAVPGDVGIISGLEDLYFQTDGSFAPEFGLKPGWEPEKLAALGIDAAKLVVWHRAEDRAVEEERLAQVAEVARRCHDLHLPLIVEPLWYPVAGESLADPEVRDRRTASVIETAGSFRRAGADIMKVEFPVNLATQADEADAACAALAEAVDGPWVLLSAGVTFDGFLPQMAIAARHGACGFAAGRAIWGDGVGRFDAARRAEGARVACERLDRLTEALHASPHPAIHHVAPALAAETIGPDWYRTAG